MGDIAAEILEHHGVKGMRWGVTRSTPSAVSVNVGATRRGKVKIKTAGGQRKTAADDAVRAHVTKQRLKKGGVNSLSNDELSALTRRLSLEKQVQQQTQTAGQKFIMNLLKQQGQQQLNQTIKEAKKK